MSLHLRELSQELALFRQEIDTISRNIEQIRKEYPNSLATLSIIRILENTVQHYQRRIQTVEQKIQLLLA